jgi:hypothetical protein
VAALGGIAVVVIRRDDRIFEPTGLGPGWSVHRAAACLASAG